MVRCARPLARLVRSALASDILIFAQGKQPTCAQGTAETPMLLTNVGTGYCPMAYASLQSRGSYTEAKRMVNP